MMRDSSTSSSIPHLEPFLSPVNISPSLSYIVKNRHRSITIIKLFLLPPPLALLNFVTPTLKPNMSQLFHLYPIHNTGENGDER